MDIKEIKFIIGNSSPFNKLKERRLNKLLKICEVKEYKNDEIIYKEGGPPDYFYFLFKGRVVVSAMAGQKDSRIEILKRGTCFGIISLLTDTSHSVTARSIETSFVLRAEKSRFKEFLKKNPLISLDFLRILSQRVKVRSKPKRIFQSKKIGIMGDALAGKTTYMFNLGLKLKEQTKKDIICIQIISGMETSGKSSGKVFSDTDNKDKILSLEDFQEGIVSNHIIKDEIDRLCIKVDIGCSFLPLLNFFSESYHFILYEIPCEFSKRHLDEFVEPAQQLHLILLSYKRELKTGGFIIKELKAKNPLNWEKIKVILAEFRDTGNLSFDKKRKLLNHPVYATLPSHSSEDYSKVIRRIAREVGEVVLGLALGSGAAYGFSHIGVLKVLEQNGIVADVICGSSMGGMIAALWAAGFKMQDVERFAEEFGKKISTFSIVGFSFPFKGIMKARRLENILKRIFKKLTFNDLKHTLKIVAFDFRRRKTVILEEGPLYKAVAASCAMPGIFEPVKFKKDILLDGGILNPLPTEVVLNYDAYRIIASNITLSEEQAIRECGKRSKFHIFDFIFGSIEIMQQQFVQRALKIADIVIHPNLEGLGWMEFEKISELIKRGEDAAWEKIEEIKRLEVF